MFHAHRWEMSGFEQALTIDEPALRGRNRMQASNSRIAIVDAGQRLVIGGDRTAVSNPPINAKDTALLGTPMGKSS